MYKRILKRLIDLTVSVVLAIGLAPVWLTVGGLVWWRLGIPVLFRQTRAGLKGQPFHVVKFRTMTDAVDEQGKLLPDEQRLTRFGGFLRASSLDGCRPNTTGSLVPRGARTSTSGQAVLADATKKPGGATDKRPQQTRQVPTWVGCP